MLSPHKQVSQAHALLSVATLASDALVEKEFMGYLTLAERDRLQGIRNTTRRKKWLAGRLAAKYLYLEHQNPLRPRRAPAEMNFTGLARDSIASFAPSSYREVEILPAGGSTGNVPRLRARDAGQSYPDISLSHTDGLSCACLAYGATVGVDLELPVRRLDSFYRVNFTRAESEWVGAVAGRNDISPFWLYTVLWSLKESALKFRHCGEASVWDMPNIEINMLSDTTDWARLCNRTALGDEFVFLPIEINERCGTRHAQVALTATRHLILVISK